MRTGTRLLLAGLTVALATPLVGVHQRPTAAADGQFVPGTREAAAAAADRPWSPPGPRSWNPLPGDRYEPAGGCYALGAADGGWVARDDDGYQLVNDPGAADRFHLEPTDLGRYLLFGSDTRVVSLADSLLGEVATELPRTTPGGQLGGLSWGLTDDLAEELATGPLSALTGRGSAVIAAEQPEVLADWDLDVLDDAGTVHLTSVAMPDLRLTVTDGRVGIAEVDDPDAATGFRLRLTDGCAAWPEVEINIAGPYVHAPTPTGETRGHLDAHLHGMAFEFLGGRARCGRPWHPYGVAVALQGCPEHELPGGRTHVLETFLSGRDPVAGHDTTGWPTFTDWPQHDSLTYEQTYYRWLERAWRGGLRLYVNLLVDNNQLCTVHPWKHNSCNEMDGVRLQAQRMRELERYVDAQSGGPGQGWLRIVADPFEARRVVNEGRLAVVLGIEVSRLFDCDLKLGQPGCTPAEVDERLAEVYDLGVRQMELVNKFDNAFSGVAGDSGETGLLVNSANVLETGSFWRMGACPDHGHDHDAPRARGDHDHDHDGPRTGGHAHGDHGYKGHDRRQYNLGDDAGVPDELVGRDALAGVLLQKLSPLGAAPIYGKGPHCNHLGLSELGEHLLGRMRERGMLFDPDHMSARGRHEALLVMEEAGYSGVISSHSWADDDIYRRILALGGVVTPMAGGSSGFVDVWRDLRGWADDRYLFGLGFGSDINGFATQGGPRGGEDQVVYPFEGFGGVTVDRQVSGERTFDINTDGVAHYGLYPDWIEDLRLIAGDDIIADLERGPEAYLQMWERAVGVAPDACRDDVDDLTADQVDTVTAGMPAEQVLLALGQPAVRGHDAWRYCLDDGEAVIAFTDAGQVAEVSADAGAPPGHLVAEAARSRRPAGPPATPPGHARPAGDAHAAGLPHHDGHTHPDHVLAGAAGLPTGEALLPLALLLAGVAGAGAGVVRARQKRSVGSPPS